VARLTKRRKHSSRETRHQNARRSFGAFDEAQEAHLAWEASQNVCRSLGGFSFVLATVLTPIDRPCCLKSDREVPSRSGIPRGEVVEAHFAEQHVHNACRS